jgi:quinol monooxygenase YgiN
VVWDSIEAHESARASESFKRFRAAFGSHAIGGSMEHFDLR